MTRDPLMLDGGTITEDDVNTIPSQEELRAQVRMTPEMRAGRKDGTAWYIAHVVEDGYAYRAAGASEDTEWSWARPADFFNLCEVWSIRDGAEDAMIMGAALRQVLTLQTSLQLAFQSMGKASKARYKGLRRKAIRG